MRGKKAEKPATSACNLLVEFMKPLLPKAEEIPPNISRAYIFTEAAGRGEYGEGNVEPVFLKPRVINGLSHQRRCRPRSRGDAGEKFSLCKLSARDTALSFLFSFGSGSFTSISERLNLPLRDL